jgi:hypothetical protein
MSRLSPKNAPLVQQSHWSLVLILRGHDAICQLSHHPSEKVAEVRLVAKAAFRCDLAKRIGQSSQPTSICFKKSLLRSGTQQLAVDGLALLLIGEHNLTYREVAYPMLILI